MSSAFVLFATVTPSFFGSRRDHFNEGGNRGPVHRVELDGFYMDVHEVTVGQFRDLPIRVAITMAVIGIL